MIRFVTFYNNTALRRLPSLMASEVLRPGAAVLSGHNCFSSSMNRKTSRSDDELLEKTFTDEFDESDSIEVGKHTQTGNAPEPSGTLTSNKETWSAEPSSSSSPATQHRRSRGDFASFPSIWDQGLFSPRPLFGGFEDMFPRELFPSLMQRRQQRNNLLSMLNQDWSSMMADFAADPSMTLIRSSPGYDIKETDTEYEIAMNVPKEIKASDLVVDMEEEGTCLHVTGQHESEQDGARVRRYFEKSFMIGDDIDPEHITANLSNGLLVVKAPKLAREHNQRPRITVTENPHAGGEAGETGIHEVPVESGGEATHDATYREETTGGVAVNTMERPVNEHATGRENVGEGTGIDYGSPDTDKKSGTEVESTRYSLSDHKDDTGGPTREYPA